MPHERPPSVGTGGVAPWDPWQALRERPEIELRYGDLRALHGLRGLWQRDALGDVIVLDAGLDARSRRCVLAHELVHAERGIGHGAATPATMEREEEHVRREVARRLVPIALLAPFVARRVELTGAVETAEVAEDFDVELEVAAKALDLLRTARRPAA